MRSIAVDPNSRENFMLAYRLINILVKKYHFSNRLHVLGYINKTKGYYTVYLTQDPASPLSSAFGYFNISLGNFRSVSDSEVYYYFNDYKDGKTEEEITEKIETMIGLPMINKDIEITESNTPAIYTICVNVLASVVQKIANYDMGFAIENEICPYRGPYSRTPDNNLWHELLQAIEKHGHSIKERCTYDYFVIGTGVPSGPVYKAWGFIANDGKVYSKDKEPLDIVERYNSGISLAIIADEIMDHLGKKIG
ncbi:hypothetical protein IMX26_02100 [Clostridium sp. 'deep sea']|uniref:hypothetical protein n=1 Tax=Clostridium sp. 'deep sea' TaxID=2779445 RepID=UPI0018964B1B|nr:hypothetical protein [Clostridium sp. 'deep sea']QOR35643.1 hypothetical protein IMX26_02100 [Clostridium sp. 'deep sea']